MHLTYKACIKFEVNEMSDHVVFDVTDDMGLRLASDLYALLQQFHSHCYGALLWRVVAMAIFWNKK